MAPSNWRQRRFADVAEIAKESLSTAVLAGCELVRLYSIPAFDDRREPEEVAGASIGSNKFAVPKDCVLLSRLNPRIPRVWRVTHDGACLAASSTEFWPITAVQREVDYDYLAHFLRSPLFLEHPSIRPASTTNSHQRIEQVSVERFTLALPSLAEQRKIAAILSSVDETIEKTEAVIAQLDVVKKAMLEELLTRGIPGRHLRFKQTEIGEVPEEWSLAPLGTIGNQFGSLWSDGDWIESKDQDPEGGIRLLQVGNVRVGSVHLGGSPRWINKATFERLGCTEVREGDILISRMADPIGRAGIVPALPFKAVTAVDCAILRVDPTRIVASYIVNYLNSPRTLARVASLATGTTRSRVSRTTLGLLSVPVPALDEQRALAESFDAVDRRQQAEGDAIEKLVAVKSSLSSALLSGDLRVRTSGGAV